MTASIVEEPDLSGISRTTPTTSRGRSPETTSSVNRLPIGFSPGQNRRAAVSLMTAVHGEDAVSRASNSRPRTSRAFIVAKKSGVTRKYLAARRGAIRVGHRHRPALRRGRSASERAGCSPEEEKCPPPIRRPGSGAAGRRGVPWSATADAPRHTARRETCRRSDR